MMKYKLVFLGDQSVGKTSLITRFIYDSFDTTYQATIGIDFLSKTMFEGDCSIRLQLWDTAGQERFKSLIPSYVRNASAIIIVYDISNIASFEAVNKWYKDAKELHEDHVIYMFVGNKTDLENNRVVSEADGAAKAKELDALFIETSAKSSYNVKEMFRKIAEKLSGRGESLREAPNVVQLTEAPSTVPYSSYCSC